MKLSRIKSHILPLAFGGVLMAMIAISILSRFSAYNVWDDAYMFVRYADHVIQYGQLSWNPDGEPTYGLTSLLYLAVVTPVRLFINSSPAFTAALSSLFCGILFLVLLNVLIYRHAGFSPVHAVFFIFFFFFILAGSGWHWVVHFTSGMDTAFVMTFMAIYFLAACQYQDNPTPFKAFLLGILGGLSFAVRPDILIYTITVPSSFMLFGGTKKFRKYFWITAVVMVVFFGLEAFFNTRYFHSQLPLPFYAKGLKHYGPFIRNFYRFIPIQEFLIFTGTFWPFFVFLGADIFLNLKTWWRDRTALDKGMLLGTLVFFFYYLFFVLQVMYYHQRFYYPALPALIFLASRSFKNLLDRLLSAIQRTLSASPQFLKGFLLMILIGFTFTPFLWVIRDLEAAVRGGYLARFDVNRNSYQVWAKERWYRLDEFSKLPDDLVIATTEIGHPAAMNPNKTIVDLSGLNEKEIAYNGFSAKRIFQKYKPDLVYLPHPHYIEMITQIENDSTFQSDYITYSSDHLGALMGVALFKQSVYFKEMEAIIKNEY